MNLSHEAVLFFIINLLSVNAASIRDTSYYDDTSLLEDDTPQAKFLIPFFNATAFWQSKHLWKYPQTTTQATTTSTTTAAPSTTTTTTTPATTASTTTPTSTPAPPTPPAPPPQPPANATNPTRQAEPLLGFVAIPPTGFDNEPDYFDPVNLTGDTFDSVNTTINRRRRPFNRRRPTFTPVLIYGQPSSQNQNPYMWPFLQPNFWG